MKARTIIIKLFVAINLLGVLFIEGLFYRIAFLFMFTLFFYLDCERYFKNKFMKPSYKTESVKK